MGAKKRGGRGALRSGRTPLVILIKYRKKLESSEATRVAMTTKHKGVVDGLKIKEKLALAAATTSSKVVDTATKQTILSKTDRIREMRKELQEQSKQLREGKYAQEKVLKLTNELDSLIREKGDWTKKQSALIRTNKTLEKKVDDQVGAKYSHLQKMAEFAMKTKQIALDQTVQKQSHVAK